MPSVQVMHVIGPLLRAVKMMPFMHVPVVCCSLFCREILGGDYEQRMKRQTLSIFRAVKNEIPFQYNPVAWKHGSSVNAFLKRHCLQRPWFNLFFILYVVLANFEF
jgi:hypothetical protein